jgi:uncharacterized protein
VLSGWWLGFTIMHFFFDFLIIAFLVIDVALIATLVHQELHIIRRKRPHVVREIVAAFVLLIALAAGSLVFYGSFIEPRSITVRHESIVLQEDGETHVRIALLSDVHAGPYSSARFIERVIDRTLVETPDLVLFAGDFVATDANNAEEILQGLGKVSGLPQGAVAVLGNHDYLAGPEVVEELLAQFDVKLLKNESVLVGEEGAELAIVGVDDLWFGTVDFRAATEDIPEGVPQILLAHNPDVVYALEDRRFAAILAAHTHGGQIRLPGIGPIAPIPTVLGKAYDRGVFSWAGMPLVITQGIGVTGPRARLFAPPEIMILDVTY